MRLFTGRRKPWSLVPTAFLFLLALSPSLALLWQAPDMPLLGRFKDDTIYLECARSLATGAGYRIPSLPGQPFQTKYPPLWPLALSAVWRINPGFPANLALAGVFGWAAVPAYLALAWALFVRCGLHRAAAWLAVFVLAASGQVLLFGATIMAELWASAALLACFLAAERARSGDHPDRRALLAGVLAAVAYLIKSSALPLLVSLPLCFLLRRQYRRAALSFAPVFAAVAGWNLWARIHAADSTDLLSLYNTSYLGYYLYGLTWHDFLRMVWVNLRALYSGLCGLFLPGVGNSLFETVLSIVAIGAAVSGAVRFGRRTGCWQYPIFAIGFLVQLLVWNFPPSSRLLFPLLPLLLAGIATEIANALRPPDRNCPERRLTRAVSLVTAGLLVPVCLIVGIASYGAVFHSLPGLLAECRRETADKRSAYAWISAHTPLTAGILADDDELLHLYTGRTAAPQILPAALLYGGPEEAIRNRMRSLPAYARAHHLDYVLLTSTDLARANLERFRPLVKETMSGAPGFVRVYRSDQAEIYRDEAAARSLR